MATSKKKNEVAKKEEEQTAVVAQSDLGGGAGFENQTADDITMPTIYLLQALSPQVVNNEPEGSKPGLLFNNVTQELTEEILFVPATTRHEYVEFIQRKRGGGFVRTYEPNDPVVKRCKATQPFGNYKVKDPEGQDNELIEFFSVFGVQADMGGNVLGFAVLRFKSTKITVYKTYNTRMRTLRVPRDDGAGMRATDINEHFIKITSVGQSHAEGDSFNFRMQPAIENNLVKSLLPSDDPRNLAAVEVRELVDSGRAVAEYEDNTRTQDAADQDMPF